MFKLLTGLFVILSFSSFASDALISQKLAGEYEIIKRKGKGAQEYCENTLKISVTESGVFTSAFDAHFYFKANGCKTGEGDIGPLRTRCTRFSNNEVSYSDTQPLTIVGFVRESTSVSLDFGSQDKLTYKHSTTEVPFGILGLWNDRDFSCKYQRIGSK